VTILGGVIKNSKQLAGLKETWVRLGRIDLASKPVIISLLVAHTLTVFGFELGRVGERPFLTLAIALMAEVLFWGSYLTMYALQVWFLGNRSSVLVKVFIIVFSNLVRTFALELELVQFGLVDQVRLADRFLGDSTGILILLVGIAYIQVVVVDLSTQELELEQARRRLTEQARSSKISAESADQNLRSKTQDMLGAQLKAITRYLKSAKAPSAERVAKEIQDLIDSKVRPLSVELWQRLERIEEPIPIPSSAKPRRFPRVVYPALDFRPTVIFPLAGLNIFITAPGLSDWALTLAFGLWMLSFLVVGQVLKFLYPKKAGSGIWFGATAIALMSLLAWSPSVGYLLVRSADYPALQVLSFTSSMVIILTAVGVGIWSAFKRERVAYLEEIDSLNKERSRQLALVDQAVWVARRNWSFLVHGTVQGALSVALSRMQLADSVTPELANQVLKDVERARGALNQTQSFNQPWDEVWPQIEQTWEGVCEVTHTTSPEADLLLEASGATATCVAEIAKELVSNAFRHGKATQIQIEISLASPEDVLITSTNNGELIQEDRVEGIGSEMFGELAASWGWSNTLNGPRFTAVIPVATNP
jgi:signal transduction histidine kinase